MSNVPYGPRPILQNGLGSPLSIFDWDSTQHHDVGTRAHLTDGRVFYYARNSGIALVAGQIVQAELHSVDMDDLATDTHLAGATSINVTPVGTKTYAANELAGGYVCPNSGTTGAGITYKIQSHAATTAATQFAVNLVDPVAVSFNADTTASVFKNPWMDTVVAATGTAHLVVGVPNAAVGAGSSTAQYYWCQTWGVASVNYDITEVAGMAQVSGASTAGQIQDSAAVTDQVIGICMFASVAGDFCPTFLQIAP